MKRVFFSGGGKTEAEGKDLAVDVLGKKGFGLAEMTSVGMPIPASFTIGIPACEEYLSLGRRLPDGLELEVKETLAKLEKCVGRRLGQADGPLLVSIRAGAARVMPGMLGTILNLGLNDCSVEGLAARTGDPRFAYDSYRRFIEMFSSTVMGLSKEPMEKMLNALRRRIGVKTDLDIPANKLKDLCNQLKVFYRKKKGEEFPQDPMDQLWGAIKAAFDSWESEMSVGYRRREKISGLKGVAVSILQTVFGNKGETSGTGLCFARDPNSGENVFCGDYLINARGEDMVDGTRTTMKVTELEARLEVIFRSSPCPPFGIAPVPPHMGQTLPFVFHYSSSSPGAFPEGGAYYSSRIGRTPSGLTAVDRGLMME